MKPKKIFFMLAAAAWVSCQSSCSDQKGASGSTFDSYDVIAERIVTNGETLIVCNPAAVKQSFAMPLSRYVTDFEMVRLESKDEAIVNPHHTTVTEQYIGVRDNENRSPYKLFTRKGKFVCSVGGIGQGPGEYGNLYDDQIDDAANRVYLLPWMTNKILTYDLKGNYMGDIPLPYRVPKAKILVNFNQKQVIVTTLAFGEMPTAWIQDFDGNIIRECRAKQLQLTPDFSNEILSHKLGTGEWSDFYVARFPSVSDTLYHYNAQTNAACPRFAVHFTEKDIPGHFLYEFPGFYVVDFFESAIWVDKETLKGGRCTELVIDQLGGIPFRGFLMNFRNGYFVENVDPGVLQSQIEKRLANPEKLSAKDKSVLEELAASISDDDNNYILIAKWKRK